MKGVLAAHRDNDAEDLELTGFCDGVIFAPSAIEEQVLTACTAQQATGNDITAESSEDEISKSGSSRWPVNDPISLADAYSRHCDQGLVGAHHWLSVTRLHVHVLSTAGQFPRCGRAAGASHRGS